MPSTPIIFFPGIMGSRLYFPNSRRYWDPDSTRRMLWWMPVSPFRSDEDNRKQLHFLEPAGVIAESVPGEERSLELGWGGAVWSFYGSYLRGLRSLPNVGPVHCVGYDWRQDLRSLGEYAAEKIRTALEATGAGSVCLIGHSMGGLVIRSALRAAPELTEHIGRILFICQPATGAVVLYRRLFTGLSRGLDGGGGAGDRAFRFILGNSRSGFVGNMSGLPGAVQLMPSRHFPKDDGRHWHDALDNGTLHADLYTNPASPPGLLGASAHPDPAVRADFRDRIEEKTDAHDWLGEPIVPPSVDAWQVAGDACETDVSVRFDGAAIVPVRKASGDDTVPRPSATAMRIADPWRTAILPDLRHSTACLDVRVLNWTQGIFT